VNVLIIGGSRYFGRRLVERLCAAGDRVTVLNRGSAAPPRGTTRHLVADRDDGTALRAALRGLDFDVVIDQVCYTPRQAEITRRAVAGRVGRYVLTSTVEVYFPTADAGTTPLTEDRVVASRWDGAAGSWTYAEGKRQAEAVFAAEQQLATVAVRCAHVLGGGAADFTGRLAHYVDRIRAGRPVAVHARPTPASFVRDVEMAAFLEWAARGSVAGPVNAAATGALDVLALCAAVGVRVGRTPRLRLVEDGPASPFSFPASRPLDTGRAARHGFAFSQVADWLPDVIDEVP
jgi:nucleoside-diphosphate-sugar epimerase